MAKFDIGQTINIGWEATIFDKGINPKTGEYEYGIIMPMTGKLEWFEEQELLDALKPNTYYFLVPQRVPMLFKIQVEAKSAEEAFEKLKQGEGSDYIFVGVDGSLEAGDMLYDLALPVTELDYKELIEADYPII